MNANNSIRAFLSLMGLLAACDAEAAANGLGDKPYLGWSSWSLCASSIPGYGQGWLNETNVLAMSDAMRRSLQPYGYTYINLDGGWTDGFDSYGRPIPDPERFPRGIRPIADYVHAKGQKLGVHFICGLYPEVYSNNYPIYGTSNRAQDIVYQPLTRTTGWKSHYAIDWSHPAAQAYIDSIANQFASWGVDLVKLDGITPDVPQAPQASPTDNRGDVAAWSAALIKTGRPIWFTLSWYVNPAYGAFWRQYANGMRANGDVEWAGHDQLVSWTEPYFGLRARWLDTTQTQPKWRNGPNRTMEQWLPYIGHGTWADMDSLDVGVGAMDGLSENERQSVMTLWVICSSPLYSGDDLTKLDAFGLRLLTNAEVIAVNQAGLVPKAIVADGKNPVWWSRNADGSVNVALFNLNDAPSNTAVDFNNLGFTGSARVRDLWTRADLGRRADRYSAALAEHACQFIKVTADMKPPEAEISNSVVRAKFYLPDPKQGYYRGTRFDWSGVIFSLSCGGHEYFGKWFDHYDPKTHDAVMGPVEEFRADGAALGYAEARPGGTFVKIGVGVLRKPDASEYSFSRAYDLLDPGRWAVRCGSNRIEFIHALSSDSGYAYEYRKTVRLMENQPVMVIEHALKNTGKRVIETAQYNHNFFVIDGQPTGPDSTVKFSFDVRALNDLKGLAEARNRQFVFLKELEKGQALGTYLKGFGAASSDYDLRIENRRAGAGVRITGDQPISDFYFWSTRTTVCPEPYVKMLIEPGREFAWSLRYEFYPLSPPSDP